jgi:hypothetical protein
MFRRGDTYTLTYDDSQLPKHYGWKIDCRLEEIEKQYRALLDSNRQPREVLSTTELESQVRSIIGNLDEDGRWISIYRGEPLVGQPKFAVGSRYLSSEVFSENLGVLSEYLARTRAD